MGALGTTLRFVACPPLGASFFLSRKHATHVPAREQMFSWLNNVEHIDRHLGGVDNVVMCNSTYRGEGTENRMFV